MPVPALLGFAKHPCCGLGPGFSCLHYKVAAQMKLNAQTRGGGQSARTKHAARSNPNASAPADWYRTLQVPA